MDNKLFLEQAAIKSVFRSHPWIYAGGVSKISGNPASGETVRLLDRQGNFLAWAWYSERSRIIARVLSLREEPDDDFIIRRIDRAIFKRNILLEDDSRTALRLVHGECDGLPGLIVDLYNDVAVLKALSSGADSRKNLIADYLMEKLDISCVYERGDDERRRLEGLRFQSGVLKGSKPNSQMEIKLGPVKQTVNIFNGPNTGLFLDQFDSRKTFAGMAKGKKVLDCFGGSGGFALQAIANGSKGATLVETSADAIRAAINDFKLNDFKTKSSRSLETAQGNAFGILRQYDTDRRYFDLIVLDPPPSAEGKSGLSRTYRDINDLIKLSMAVLTPGGTVFLFNRSPGINFSGFRTTVERTLLDNRMDSQVTGYFGPSIDFPVLNGFPESERLVGLSIRLLS